MNGRPRSGSGSSTTDSNQSQFLKSAGKRFSGVCTVLQDHRADWKIRYEHLEEIATATNEAAQLQIEPAKFARCAEDLPAPLIMQLSDPRSEIVRQACSSIAALATFMGSEWSRSVSKMLTPLITVAANPNKVIRGYGQFCVMTVLEHVQSKTILMGTLEQLKATRSKPHRQCCMECLRTVLVFWNMKKLRSCCSALEQAIISGLRASTQETRSSSAKCFWLYVDHFTDKNDSFFLQLNPRDRLLVQAQGQEEDEAEQTDDSSISNLSTASTFSARRTVRRSSLTGPRAPERAVREDAARPQVAVGGRVITRYGPGLVRYMGEMLGREGNWLGVELEQDLDAPTAESDGSVDGVAYFACAPARGSFTRPNLVTAVPSHRRTRSPTSSLRLLTNDEQTDTDAESVTGGGSERDTLRSDRASRLPSPKTAAGTKPKLQRKTSNVGKAAKVGSAGTRSRVSSRRTSGIGTGSSATPSLSTGSGARRVTKPRSHSVLARTSTSPRASPGTPSSRVRSNSATAANMRARSLSRTRAVPGTPRASPRNSRTASSIGTPRTKSSAARSLRSKALTRPSPRANSSMSHSRPSPSPRRKLSSASVSSLSSPPASSSLSVGKTSRRPRKGIGSPKTSPRPSPKTSPNTSATQQTSRKTPPKSKTVKQPKSSPVTKLRTTTTTTSTSKRGRALSKSRVPTPRHSSSKPRQPRLSDASEADYDSAASAQTRKVPDPAELASASSAVSRPRAGTQRKAPNTPAPSPHITHPKQKQRADKGRKEKESPPSTLSSSASASTLPSSSSPAVPSEVRTLSSADRALLVREHRLHVQQSARHLQSLSSLLTSSENNDTYVEDMIALLQLQFERSQHLIASYTAFQTQ